MMNMNTKNYILVEKQPVLTEDYVRWAIWFEESVRKGTRHVEVKEIPARKPFKKGSAKMIRKINHFRAQPILVSTIFLGRDCSDSGAAPALFETNVHGGRFDRSQENYASWEQAEKGHYDIVDKITKSMVI